MSLRSLSRGIPGRTEWHRFSVRTKLSSTRWMASRHLDTQCRLRSLFLYRNAGTLLKLTLSRSETDPSEACFVLRIHQKHRFLEVVPSLPS